MTDRDPFVLSPGSLTLEQLQELWREGSAAGGPAASAGRAVALDPAARAAVERSAAAVAAVVREERRVYGITTGFGSLAKTTISADQVTELQRRLVLSHCAGVGAPFDDEVVRLVLLLKINALARGYSGIRYEVIEALLTLLNAGAYPVIPSQGSVGASGDLAPLAHLSAALMGIGEIRRAGQARPAGAVLAELGLAPVRLAAKEGLALLNGTQVSTALALVGLFKGLDVYAAALVAGAMSVDAALGTDVPFDPRIQAVRGHPGQSAVAVAFRRLLEGSEIRLSHLDCDRVQDPYSLRCQPQVMGAALELVAAAAAMIGREANAVSDNPLVFAEGDLGAAEVLSGGNFHAEPVAMAADMLAIALAEVGALSERRMALLVDAAMSSLPAFLIAEPGLNSGFMIAQVTSAALASENKSLAHPASVDSLPTSANQEDHVSMATYAARRLTQMAANCGRIVAIELLAAAQGIELRNRLSAPGDRLRTGALLEQVKAGLRAEVPFLDEDREMGPDIERAYALIATGWLREVAWPALPEPPLAGVVFA